MRVEVILPFMRAGAVVPAGSTVDLPDDQAHDLLARQRVRRVDPAAPVRGPMTTTSNAALIKGAPRKGKQNAE